MLQKYSRHYVAEHKNDIERWNNYGVVYFFFSFLFGLHLACSIMLLKSLAWDCLSNLILLYASICIIMSYMWPLYIVAFKDIFHFVSVWCVDAFCVDTCMYIYIYLYTYVFFNIIGYTYNLPEKNIRPSKASSTRGATSGAASEPQQNDAQPQQEDTQNYAHPRQPPPTCDASNDTPTPAGYSRLKSNWVLQRRWDGWV